MDALVPASSATTRSPPAAAVQGIYSSFGHVGGPALGGILIASAGLTATYAIDVVTFSASLVAAIAAPEDAAARGGRASRAERDRRGLPIRPLASRS